MLKSILNLNNAQISSKQQQEVKGAAGIRPTCRQNGSQCTQSDQYGLYMTMDVVNVVGFAYYYNLE